MSQSSLHFNMLKFALDESLLESRKRFRANAQKLTAFQRSIESGDHRKVNGTRLKVAEAEIGGIADDQERLISTIPELEKTREAFGSLSDTEKQLLHRRLANPSGGLKLVLQNHNGEVLAA